MMGIPSPRLFLPLALALRPRIQIAPQQLSNLKALLLAGAIAVIVITAKATPQAGLVWITAVLPRIAITVPAAQNQWIVKCGAESRRGI